ncbi:MAG: ribonuclease J [Candidatus Kerfeldbacteria bacterium]|nr:ribonuclease J [Candidatus Kerfeldbacteria bacterium]
MRRQQKLRITVLGGNEEVGRNCTLIEYGDDILIIDLGLQFPEEDMPGIDYIIPNLSYLRGKERNIRGVIITHGHYDHIGAIPHVNQQLGSPTIYGTDLTLAIIQKRQVDFKEAGTLNLRKVDYDDQLQLGAFRVEFFRVNHNIPGSMGIVVHTPEGTVMHTGDFKFDYNPIGEDPADFGKIAELGRNGVLALMADSTNAEREGHQISESIIMETLEDIVHKAKGRIIIGTFASLLSRVQLIIWVAEKFGRRVAIDGFSMKTNVEIAIQLGYLKANRGTIVSIEEALRMPNNKAIFCVTGAQGEDRAVLMRIANREHRFLRVEPGDTVIFSSSVIPGNERSVTRVKDLLYHEGANVIHYEMMDVHAGGHAKQEDLKLLHRLVSPRYLIPIEGNHSFLRVHANAAVSGGFPRENILIADNGQVIEFWKGKGRVTEQRVPADYVFVDGLGVGDVSNVVLRDRQQMSEDGMVVVIVTIRAKTGELVGTPDIISRGFVYMKESKKLIDETGEQVRDILKRPNPDGAANETYIKAQIRDDVGKYLFQKTERRPLIMPVVIEV